MEWCLFEKLIVAHLAEKFHAFLEPEGSLPYSQEPTTVLHFALAEFRPTPLYISLRSILTPYGVVLS